METNKRKSIFDKLYKYDWLVSDKNKYIEITEWTNGEGIDIVIDDNKFISITYGELDAINYLQLTLKYKDSING